MKTGYSKLTLRVNSLMLFRTGVLCLIPCLIRNIAIHFCAIDRIVGLRGAFILKAVSDRRLQPVGSVGFRLQTPAE